MKRKCISAAILLAVLLTLTACGGNPPAESSLPVSSEAAVPSESVEPSEGSAEEAPVRWGGTYSSESGSLLTVEMMDSNSFEFTLSADGGVLESLVARITGPGQAAYTGDDGTRLSFSYESGCIWVTAEDSTGAEFEGEYFAEK